MSGLLFLLGLVIGCVIGIVLMCMLQINRMVDEKGTVQQK